MNIKWLEFLWMVAPEAWRLGRDAWRVTERDGEKAKLVVTRLREGMAEDRALRDGQAAKKFAGEP